MLYLVIHRRNIHVVAVLNIIQHDIELINPFEQDINIALFRFLLSDFDLLQQRFHDVRQLANTGLPHKSGHPLDGMYRTKNLVDDLGVGVIPRLYENHKVIFDAFQVFF